MKDTGAAGNVELPARSPEWLRTSDSRFMYCLLFLIYLYRFQYRVTARLTWSGQSSSQAVFQPPKHFSISETDAQSRQAPRHDPCPPPRCHQSRTLPVRKSKVQASMLAESKRETNRSLSALCSIRAYKRDSCIICK